MGVFDYLDADLIAGYYSATDSLPARIALFRGDEIVRVESLPVGQEGDKAITPDDIVSISVLKDGGDGLAFIKYKGWQVCHLSAWQQLFLACGQGSLFPPVL